MGMVPCFGLSPVKEMDSLGRAERRRAVKMIRDWEGVTGLERLNVLR